jgi:hypothetical protein
LRADTTPSEWRKLEKHIRYYSEQITVLYSKLLVYEKPKLASVEVKDDQQNPIYHCEQVHQMHDRRRAQSRRHGLASEVALQASAFTVASCSINIESDLLDGELLKRSVREPRTPCCTALSFFVP